MVDYKKIGLKVGIEIHQRLATTHKLFCGCFTHMKEIEPTMEIKRKLRAVAGELGEIDRAALFEYLRDRNFHYLSFQDETCLVETDSEPPHSINQEAIRIGLEISLLFNCDIPDEIHVMRKTVIDGSNTSGFQRTAVIGLNGWINGKNKIDITQVCLEEESCGIVSSKGKDVTYRLDRLAIPLVEITTGTLIGYSPQEIQNIAYKIGMLLRSTGKVMRGIGSIRQDINISIENGARIEIKGIQELSMISRVIENEVRRQLSLLDIKEELKKRKVRLANPEIVRVTEIFKNTKCKILKSIIDDEREIFGVKLTGYSGILKYELCPNKSFGEELNDYAVSHGADGIIHSDENLKKYKLVDEFENLKKILKAKSQDCIVITGGRKHTARKALESVIARAKMALEKIPEETRVANPDSTTTFTRPLPGAMRMYPETDIPPIKIERKVLENIKKNLPESWEIKLKRFVKEFKLSSELANQILRSEYLDLFEKIVEKHKIDPNIVAFTFVSTLKDLKKRGIPIEKINDKHFMELFEFLRNKRIVREAIPNILKKIAMNPEKPVEEMIMEVITIEEVEKIIDTIIEERQDYIKKEGERAIKGIMGLVMKELRGMVDGKIVNSLVTKKIKSTQN